MTYASDREWADQFIPFIKTIVGPFLLESAPLERDISEATDLIVLRARDMRIGARVRKPGYFQQYGREFTIRAKRDSGYKTELSKIVDGWGDWLFYAHADEDNWLPHWMVVDLHVFRASLIRDSMNQQKLKCGTRPNGDGTYFKWFDVASFPTGILVKASDSILDLVRAI